MAGEDERQVSEVKVAPSRNGSSFGFEAEVDYGRYNLRESLHVRHPGVKAAERGRVSHRSGVAGSGMEAQRRRFSAAEAEAVETLWMGGWLDEEPGQEVEAGREEAFGRVIVKEEQQGEGAAVDLAVGR
ncbi:hypothetical protein ColTof4_00934 [Colletotrichum tofieldiae]|nr:hypothetical protein ColTof3_08155 [Colletotrichum tofieldiae]GKT68511.1 hypothetical protein ColTof4_00934 [Colletotrichum tofieldiae]